MCMFLIYLSIYSSTHILAHTYFNIPFLPRNYQENIFSTFSHYWKISSSIKVLILKAVWRRFRWRVARPRGRRGAATRASLGVGRSGRRRGRILCRLGCCAERTAVRLQGGRPLGTCGGVRKRWCSSIDYGKTDRDRDSREKEAYIW